MVQKYQTIYFQAYVLCISEQKLDRHLEGKAACYKNLRSVGNKPSQDRQDDES